MIKLYDDNAYLTSFNAIVTDCIKADNCYKVCLDQTAFFPEEGGQTPDKGSINGLEVSYVEIKDEMIYHYINEPLNIGENVSCEINFAHRFSNMQMHSAEHIFSGITFSLYGYNNVGFHLSDNSATMDFDGKLSNEDITMIASKVNEAIISNLPIKCFYPSSEELIAINYRSKKELDSAVRIVEISGVDICACCAPHVATTGEIGLFTVTSVESYKGGVRIHYLAGKRALLYLEECKNTLLSLSKSMSVKPSEVVSAVDSLNDLVSSLRFKLSDLEKADIERKIDTLFNKEESNRYILFFDGDNSNILNHAANYMKRENCIALAFMGNDNIGYRFIISSEDDCSEVFELLKNNGAKGGGKKNFIQGNIKNTEENIRKILN